MRIKIYLFLVILLVSRAAHAQQKLVYTDKNGKEFHLDIIYNDADQMPKNILQTDIASVQYIGACLNYFPLSISYKRILSRRVQANFLFSLPLAVGGNNNSRTYSWYMETSAEFFLISANKEKLKRFKIVNYNNYDSASFSIFNAPLVVHRSVGIRAGVNLIKQAYGSNVSLVDTISRIYPSFTKEGCLFAGLEFQKRSYFNGKMQGKGNICHYSVISYYADLIYSPQMSVSTDRYYTEFVPLHPDFASAPFLSHRVEGRYMPYQCRLKKAHCPFKSVSEQWYKSGSGYVSFLS